MANLNGQQMGFIDVSLLFFSFFFLLLLFITNVLSEFESRFTILHKSSGWVSYTNNDERKNEKQKKKKNMYVQLHTSSWGPGHV